MGFSEQMRESLGAEGATVHVDEPSGPIGPGSTGNTRVRIVGGTKSAHVDALIIRVVEAKRHWFDSNGGAITEEQALAMPDRSALSPGWSRRVVTEHAQPVDRNVDAGATEELDVQFQVPPDCGPTTAGCVVTLNAQADIKGQIDPTGNGRLTIGSPAGA